MRKGFLNALNFFIFSSLYISLCAILMIYQTNWFLFNSKPSTQLLIFVFFSTICSYNFHWYLTPFSAGPSVRADWTQRHKVLHLVLYGIGLVGSIVYFFILRKHWMALTFAAFITFLYSAPKLPQNFFRQLKDIAIGKTVFLAFVWMFVTSVLPIFTEEKPLQFSYVIFACSRFFLIYAICIIFDYRDREDDKHEGIRSMITYFSQQGIDRLFFISILLFFLFTIVLYLFHYKIYLIIVLSVPGIIVTLLYKYAKKNFSDYLYYFVLDGLMMLSGLLMLIIRILNYF